jgi:hypothetical protein
MRIRVCGAGATFLQAHLFISLTHDRFATPAAGFEVLKRMFPISRCKRARFFVRKGKVAPARKRPLWLAGNNKKARLCRAFLTKVLFRSLPKLRDSLREARDLAARRILMNDTLLT